MKQFLLFAYYNYYPEGGLNDLIGNFHTLEEAEEKWNNILKENSYGEGQILDLKTGETIYKKP